MITKIESKDFDIARDILQELDIHLAVTALLDRSSPGEIFVDDISEPRSVFAWTMHRFFLAGKSDNYKFNTGVKGLFHDRIYPLAQEKGLEGFTLYFNPKGWDQVIKDIILEDKYPIQDVRHYYSLSLQEHDGRLEVPQGFSLEPVDESLLERENLENLEELVEEMQSERPSVEDFLKKSFGSCIIHENDLVAWCLSEYNSGNSCELGIATRQGYRRRGLATITGNALAEQAQSKGITEFGWHCFARNEASIATALKLGYQKVCEYPAIWAMFDETISLAVNGNASFERQNYADAILWYLKALEDAGAPMWVYWNTACAYAHLENKKHTFRYLQEAIEKGFNDIEYFNSSPHFTKWHDTQQWAQLISKLEKMQTS